MDGFVGRRRYLDLLRTQLPQAGQAGARGKALLLRGRRRVGKTRLVEAFVAQADVPSVFFTASGQPDSIERGLFAEAVASSTLPRKHDYGEDVPATWEDALRRLTDILPDSPSVVVFDELPYVMANNPHFEGTLQKVFDRYLSRKPVLLIAIGSNEAVMRALDAHDRPFHGRATPLEISPLNPHDVAEYRQCSAPDAIDAWLLTGGMPLIVTDWAPDESREEYLRRALGTPLSALVVTGERALTAEIAADPGQRAVIHALRSKSVAFTTLGSITGLASSTLDRTLTSLTATGAIVGERPYSTATSKLRHYRIKDPYLGFWLEYVQPYAAEIDRGRGDLTARRATTGWLAWRGRAVEPLVRESLLRSELCVDTVNADTPIAHVGSYWTRNYRVEVDLVAGDRHPVAQQVQVLGSIKWRSSSRWSDADAAHLHQAAAVVPGGNAATLLAVTPEPVPLPAEVKGFTAADILAAWA